ncbi:MAG: type II secretion system F family protein, partial [Xanthomonadales bacterium]|nr:type II secretion system F family protein [Xanthomonadales bacterium]
MPLFEYKAVAPSGETVQGTMEAASLDQVVGKLQEAGNIPLSARESGGGGLSLGSLRLGRRGMSRKEVGDFTQQLATLLGAGLPLDRSLQVLLELGENDRVRRTVGDVRDRVREGGSLSDALEAQHGAFSRLYVNMVRAGEIGGTLDRTLERLADYLERSRELRESVVSASIYPIMLLLMAGLSVAILLVVVLPQFMPLFEELGGELPIMMRLLLFIGAVLQDGWWLILAALLLGVLLLRRAWFDPDQRMKLDALLLKTRWVGD